MAPVLGLILSLYFAFSPAGAQSIWTDFIAKPDAQGLTALKKAIQGSKQKCAEGSKPTAAEKRWINEAIEDGNVFAFEAGVLISKCNDATDSEDFHVSTGIFLEKDPIDFIRIVDRYHVKSEDMKRMSLLLPESTIENLTLQKETLEKRLQILKSAKGSGIAKTKSFLIKATQKQIKDRVKIEKNEVPSAGTSEKNK